MFDNERDEIRRKLSSFEINPSKEKIVRDFTNNHRLINTYMKNSNLKSLGQNLQLCFMNEINDDSFEETSSECTTYINNSRQYLDNINIIDHNDPVDQFIWIQNKLQVYLND